MSAADDNKLLARRFYIEPLEERRSLMLDELATDDYVDADAASDEERVPGPEGVKRVNDRFLAAFSDIRVTIEDQIAEGDKVVTRWPAQGTHSGDFMGIPATGKRVGTTGIEVHLIPHAGPPGDARQPRRAAGSRGGIRPLARPR